ncbi:MAG: hypothetical protein KDG52_17720 [Rhodocyclaceae bacterium]|nr:hypothetical protein [Rhodocyclaceae bacterium]
MKLSRTLSLDGMQPPQPPPSHHRIGSDFAPALHPFALRWEEAHEVAQAGEPLPAPTDEPTAAASTPSVVVEVSESAPGPATAPAVAAASSVQGDDEDSSKRYGLAPIRWGGVLSYSWRRQKADQGPELTAKTYEISAVAASYILQPWIAQIDGRVNVAFITSETQTGSNGVTGDSESVAVSGSAGASIFPLSRFPMSVRFSVSDSRSDSTLITNTQRSYRLSLRQDYRPIQGRWSTHATYDWDRIEGGTFGADTVHRLAGGYRWAADKQDFDVQGSLTENSRTDDDFSSQILVVNGNHHYRARQDLNINSTATLLRDKRGRNDGDSTLSTLQVYSSANWTPLESPWSAALAGRYSRSESDGSNERDTLNLTASGRYRFNRNLSAAGSLSTTTSRSNDRVQTVFTQAASMSYSADPLRFGKYSYSWGTGAGVSNTISDERDSRAASASASHSLNRQWIPSQTTVVSASLGQSLSYNRRFGVSDFNHSSTLSNTGSVSVSTNPSDATSGTFSLSVSDTRSRGDRRSEFQMLNAQMFGNWRLSRRAQLHANLSYQKSWRDDSSSDSEEVDDPFAIDDSSSEDSSLNGSLSYFHDRPFSVQGLRYSLRYTASQSNSNEREFGVLDADREETTQDLEQNLDYRIGRLTSRLQLRVAEVDGRKNAVLFFRVSRSFGGY